MVSSFPGCVFILFGCYFNPVLVFPVQDANRVEPLLVGPSSAEYDDLFVFYIVIHGAVGSLDGKVTSGLNLPPLHRA
jgi:hypothetical protein